MKKLLILVILFLVAVPAYASVSTDFDKTDIGATTWYIGQWDKLALNIVIPSNNGALDTVNALTIKNSGNAYYGFGLKELHLWTDAGAAGFQGWGFDNDLGAGTYIDSQYGWYWKDLNVDVPPAGLRLYVTAEMWASPPATNVNYTVQLSIPQFNDVNGDGEFDVRDAGIFMNSKNNGPTDFSITNTSNQTISYANRDTDGPTVIYNNLANNQVINTSSYVIAGQARDQGSSSAAEVFISITQPGDPLNWQLVTITGANYSTWEYNWQNIEQGSYYIQVKAKDFLGYEKISSAIAVTAAMGGNLSQQYSSAVVDSATAVANGLEKITINVTVRNEDDFPITDRTLYLKEVRDEGNVVIKSTGTGELGKVNFVLASTKPGIYSYQITLDEEQIGDIVTIEFIEETVAPTIEAINYLDGSWIKLASHSAVYFLDKNNVRHAYPVQAVWESYFGTDFSAVVIIDNDTMASYSLGRNVPFKTGTLMKFPTVPKVYKVEGETKRWITDEAAALANFGAGWADQIKFIPDSFISDYTDGSDISN